MKHLLLTLLTLLTACGKTSSSASSGALYSELAAKAELYRSLQTPGAPLDVEHCDGLLWSTLASVGGMHTPVGAYEVAPGQWLRRPVGYPECFTNGESQSTVSRDMLLGVLWYAWAKKDPGVTERLWEYVRHNGWKAGEGELSRTLVTPALARLLVDTHHKINGNWLPGSGWTQTAVVVEPEGLTGYQRHLQWLRVALRAEVANELSASSRKLLEKHAELEPRNPMPLAILGRWGNHAATKQTVLRLLTDNVWPNDRLPTTADRCAYWPVERDNGSDWAPCADKAENHSGAELLFIFRLMKGKE